MNNILDRLNRTNKFKFYAPFFRVFIALYLLKKAITTWEYYGLLFKGEGFLNPLPSHILSYFNISTLFVRNNWDIFYSLYVLFVILFLFGIGKRFTVVILYMALQIVQELSWVIMNGGDNLLEYVLLYFIFIDSFSKLSVSPLKYKNTKALKFSNLLSNLGGYSICIHLCIVYFISGIHKIHADVWFNGIATYYILSSERFLGTPWNLTLVKSGVFVTLTTYGTMLIECLYPILIWFKNTRKIMIIGALGLHLGIGIFMMLYDFQIIFILLQGFFVSNKEWRKIGIWCNEQKILFNRKIPNLIKSFR